MIAKRSGASTPVASYVRRLRVVTSGANNPATIPVWWTATAVALSLASFLLAVFISRVLFHSVVATIDEFSIGTHNLLEVALLGSAILLAAAALCVPFRRRVLRYAYIVLLSGVVSMAVYDVATSIIHYGADRMDPFAFGLAPALAAWLVLNLAWMTNNRFSKTYFQ